MHSCKLGEIKKHCPLKETVPAIKHSNLQRKNMILGTATLDHNPFFKSYYFTKIFVHLLIITAVCNFNIYKLIGWKHLLVQSHQEEH